MRRRSFDISESLLTAKQAASILNVVERTVLNEIARGNLTACRIGRLWRIHKSDLVAYVRARQIKAIPK